MSPSAASLPNLSTNHCIDASIHACAAGSTGQSVPTPRDHGRAAWSIPSPLPGAIAAPAVIVADDEGVDDELVFRGRTIAYPVVPHPLAAEQAGVADEVRGEPGQRGRAMERQHQTKVGRRLL